MHIEILGAESMGVRSLSTFVTTSNRRILIDPSAAVTPRRDGLPPHPSEMEALGRVREAIQARAAAADAIVITHFHHDHFSSFKRRPFNLTDRRTARDVYLDTPVYVKDWRQNLNRAQRIRARQFLQALERDVIVADGGSFENVTFSPAVKHGEVESRQGWVVMVSIDDGAERLVFASDIQCIERESVDWILDREPTIVITSGPPIHMSVVSQENKEKARLNLIRVAGAVPTTVVDHHLLRTEAYRGFLQDVIARGTLDGNRVLTAAEFMGRPNQLLEANRKHLWDLGPGATAGPVRPS